MKRSITAISIITAALLLAGCATVGATQSQARELPWEGFAYAPRDWAASELPQGAVRIAAEQQEKAEQAESEVAAEDEYYEEEWVDYGYSVGYVGYRGDPDGLNNFNGVYEYDGRTESFYSGQAVYTNDLTVDDDGFYRTDEGYYAVATSSGDYSIGDTFEGSMGTCVVVDDGASPGVTDYYVNGWY